MKGWAKEGMKGRRDGEIAKCRDGRIKGWST